MKTKEIQEGNKLIAIFMGGKMHKAEAHDHCFHTAPKKMPIAIGDILAVGSLKYDSSWDWLMPVVEKIGRTRHDNPYPKDLKKGEIIIERFEMGARIFFISAHKWTGEWEIKSIYQTYDPDTPTMSTAKSYQEMIWKTVVAFVKWHNEKK